MNLTQTNLITVSKDTNLRRCLGTLDLILLGIGAIVGAGVFVLTGVAAATYAGPAVTLSFISSGIACLFSAFSYAELAASVGGCGSAYTYTYFGFGEFIAWIIGWDLLLEYIVSVSTVAIGWSGYVNNVLQALGLTLPRSLLIDPFEGGIINLPAVLIILFLAVLLSIGIKESSRFNAIIVFIKLSAIALFIIIASQNIEISNWHPYFPFGWTGVVNGAAIVFFAYIGFDAVSTAAEEAINPQRSLPIGIITSVAISTAIYIAVAALLTGIVSYTKLNVSSPVAHALLLINYPKAAGIIALGAIAGLTTVMLVMYYGLTRICLSIARDGLLPAFFAKINASTQTPIIIILLSGIAIACVAGLVPIRIAAELVNIGTLAAFTLVSGGVIILRIKKPNLPRPFKVPFYPIVPLLGIISCVHLMLHLSLFTWARLLTWMVIGLIIYFTYGIRHSKVKN